jgi:long-chain fatty acid transport protein
MKKIVAVLFAAGVIASPLAIATNGDEMMAVGSQSTALGGTGVANFMGAESTWANPAMLGKSKGAEVTGGIVLFKPSVTNTGMPGGAASSSSANTSYIPDVSYSSRISDHLTYGVAMAGIAGMGVDYKDASLATHIKAKTNLSILRVVPTIAYNDTSYGLGLSPIFQYGSLMLAYDRSPSGAVTNYPDQKKEYSSGYGFSLGGYFNASPAMTLAASYQSKITAKYGTQISVASTNFGLCQPQSANCVGAAPFGDDLNQPAEYKLGAAYTVSSITVTADYKMIKWGSAAGYKDFDWKDQTVIALGAKYDADGYWLGVGYNNSKDPINTLPAAGDTPPSNTNPPGPLFRNSSINFFNNMFFPAIVKSSYTFGGGYSISKAMALEGSAVISPKVTKTVDISDFGGTNTTTHSQKSFSASLRYKF